MNACPRRAISWRQQLLGPSIWIAALWCAAPLLADGLVRVEEDWELVIAVPDANSAGPQVSCTLSPLGNITSTYFTIEFNHRSVPYWSPGGITLHQWNGEWRTQSLDRADRSVMQTTDEKVTWTQILNLDNGVLTFQIKNGVSTTWGPFGYSNYLKLQTYWNASYLSAYTPEVSAERSGVSYASNRVKSLKLMCVRGTLDSGSVVTDSTVRVVHQLTSQ